MAYSDGDGNGSIDATTEIIEENNYYPFGLRHKGYNNIVNGVVNNYQTFNGKEWDQSLDLNTFDLGARQMDPALGRFMVIDPMADFVNYQSPYAVADNNPIALIDIYGLGSVGDGGLWRWLRNLFKGKCNCRGGKSPSRAKKPKSSRAKKRNNRRIARRNKKNKTTTTRVVSTTTQDDSPRDPVSGVNVSPQGLVDLGGNLDFDIPQIPNIAVPTTPSNPTIDGTELPPGANIGFDKRLSFLADSDIISGVSSNEKILNDLIKTLKEYSQLRILIMSNYSRNSNSTPDRNTPEQIKHLQLSRAKAVEQFLISKGINWSRIEVGHGDIKVEGIKGRTTKFILKN